MSQEICISHPDQRKLTIKGKYHCAAGLQFNKTGHGQQRIQVVFACSEPIESKLLKLETGVPTVILSPNSECSLLGLIKQSKTKLTVKKIIIVGLIN